MTGAERVLDHILRCYPGADVFTAIDFLQDPHRKLLGTSRVHTSFVQHLPKARTGYWNYIPLMPAAFERFDLRTYDLVISNSHTVAKGVRTHRGQTNVCVLETPMRFAWDLKEYYLEHFRLNPVKRIAARVTFRAMGEWDRRTARRVDAFLSISDFVARRCSRYYGRDSEVLHPPVEVDFFVPGKLPREDYFLTASRLTPFKRLDLVVRAFREMPDVRLVVIGDGPERSRIEALRTPNVTCLGYQPDDVLREYMQRARAFLFPAPEDFGLVMAEAQACGTPVIALGVGGACEIVRDLRQSSSPPTGVLFSQGTVDDVCDAVRLFQARESEFKSDECRLNALRFEPSRFHTGLTQAVSRAMARGPAPTK